MLRTAGCPADTADAIIDHLIDADLCGVESHGIVRALQYHDEYKSGYIRTDATAEVSVGGGSTLSVDGKGGLGIPTMLTATEAGIKAAQAQGIAAVGVRNTGHTGRLGAFAEMAAAARCLFIACGGGARDRWRMVTPHGGRRAVLPMNPWCLGISGGAQGPVILDCATGQLAGG
jgi:LDH2 family malate/lactate/ureidoglycolate dehydrogenase